MLCKCVLPAESRVGKKQAKRVDFVELCEAWESGKKKILWERAMRANKRGGAKHENTDAARIQLAIRKARDGEYSRACGALVSSGIAPNTIETAQKLKSKHIVADVPACPPTPLAAVLRLSSEFDLDKILFSFARGTACGPSQLRVQHIIDVLDVPAVHAVRPTLRGVLNKMLAGFVPDEISKGMAGASLTPLFKPGNNEKDWDVRPIAVV